MTLATVRVTHTLDDLVSDLRKIPVAARKRMTAVVARNVKQGTSATQRIARTAAGPHGLNYWKRISGEMTGPLEGEWGPTGDVVGNAVGAGYRNGNTNTDLEKSLDIQAPRFVKDAGAILDAAFWPK